MESDTCLPSSAYRPAEPLLLEGARVADRWRYHGTDPVVSWVAVQPVLVLLLALQDHLVYPLR